MAQGMGLDCRVNSPTFTIVNEYLGARTLLHFDMYRLGSADEVRQLLVFLAGERAGNITGQVFGVNGGLVI